MDFGEWKNQNDEADLEKRLLKIRNESKKKHKLDEINQSGCLDNLLGLFILRVVQTNAILFLKSMSERVGSDIKRL